jgi:hypothetical protein
MLPARRSLPCIQGLWNGAVSASLFLFHSVHLNCPAERIVVWLNRNAAAVFCVWV